MAIFFISIKENRDELLPSSARQRGEFFTTDITDVTDFICDNLQQFSFVIPRNEGSHNALIGMSCFLRQQDSMAVFYHG